MLRIAQLVFLATATCLLVPRAEADPFAKGLRERGLYRLAEMHCRQQIRSEGLTDREMAEMVIELSLVAADRALDSPPQARTALWPETDAALEDYSRLQSDQPYALLIDLQRSLNLLRLAEVLRLENLDTYDSPAIEEVKTKVRSAIASLKKINEQVETLRRAAAMNRLERDAVFDERELDGLARELLLASARALRLQGLCYPPKTADRDDALLRAAAALEPLATERSPATGAWKARIALVDCLAELGQTERGVALLEGWKAFVCPVELAAPLAASHARLLLAAGQLDAATKVVASFPMGKVAEVDLVRLEIELGRWQVAAEKNTRAIDRLLATIRAAHRPQWIRRAETLVGRRFAAAGDGTSGMGLVHAAEHYYRAGQLAEAITAYDQAVEQFRSQRNRDEAFRIERTAAAVVQQMGQYEQAAARYRRLALGSLDRSDSASAHREAILCLATAAEKAPPAEKQTKLERYVEACREHLRHWDHLPESEVVRWWLGSTMATRRQWASVVEVLGPLPASSPRFETAVPVLARAYRELIERDTDSAEQQKLNATATAKLLPLLLTDERQWIKKWNPAQREVALEMARWKLPLSDRGASEAENLLTTALRGEPAPAAEWQARAVPVLAMALVKNGKTSDAVTWLRRSAGESASLEPLATNLTEQIAAARTNQERTSLGQLLLATLDVADKQSAEWKLPADRYRAAALYATGQFDQSLALYDGLVKQLPQNGDLYAERAKLLSESTDQGHRELAMTAWQRVESGSRRGSTRWFAARAARIELLVKLGRRQDAEKLFKLTKLAYPDLGGEANREQFEALSIR